MQSARKPEVFSRGPLTVDRFGSHGARAHTLMLLAQSVDAQPHGISWTQEHRGPLPETHSRGSAGRYDVAGMQAHHVGQITDQLRNPEDHVGAVAVLIG